MAHFEKMQTGNMSQNARANEGKNTQESRHSKAQRLALEQQTELVKRAQAPIEKDPDLSFDSSMTRAQVRSQFMKLVQRSREAVFA